MGIELPPELADVAAEAGVAWPQADEEAMATQAQAWRDAATSMSTLTTDADTTARSALQSLSGDTGAAATAEWKTFVEPDSGHLTSVVKDANAAADRLEHASAQIGAAKVEIVRNLVSLAQNKDAAHAAAQSGHPTALAGLETAVRGTAANVAHIQSQLVTAVQPAAGVDMATVQTPVNANPGHHLLPGVTTAAAPLTNDLLSTGTDAGGPSLQPSGHGGVANLPAQVTGDAGDLIRHGTGAVADTAGAVTGGPGHHVLPDATGLAQPGVAGDLIRHGTGAVADTAGAVTGGPGHQVLPDAGDVVHHGGGALGNVADQALSGATDLAQPGDAIPGHPGGGLLPGQSDGGLLPGQPGDVIPGQAGGGLLPGQSDGGLLPGQPGDAIPGQPGGGLLPGQPGDAGPGSHLPDPSDGSLLPGHPGDAVPGPGPHLPDPSDLPGDPEITGPVPADHFPGSDAPTPPRGQTVQAGFVGGGLEASAAPAAPVNLPPAAAAPPLAPSPQAPAFGGTPGFAAPAPAPPPAPGAAPPAAPPAAPTAPPARPTTYGPAAASPIPTGDPAPRKHIAGPPGAPPPAKGERNEVLAAFWIHMFPIGHLPVASYRPARQLPPPPPELDYAAGLRFEPGDHPQFHLVDPSARLADLKPATPQEKADFAPPPGPDYPPTPPPRPAEAIAAGYAPAAPPTPPPPSYPPAQAASHPAEATGSQPNPDPPDQKTIPTLRPVTPSAGLTADHPTVQKLLETHDPLGDINERDWDRRYLVRLGSVTAHGISPEGLEYNWPTSEQFPEGGSADGEAEVLDEDTVIDRFGTPYGRVFAADGTPFAHRSLPPAHKDLAYRRYRIRRPLPVWRAVSAAWFGQPGGGIRYRTTHSAAELVALGYLEEIA